MSDQTRDPPGLPPREMIEAELETTADLMMRTVGSAFQQALVGGVDRLTLVGLPEPLAVRATLEDMTGSALVILHAALRHVAPSRADELLLRQCAAAIRAAGGHDRADDN